VTAAGTPPTGRGGAPVPAPAGVPMGWVAYSLPQK